jgi:hypothetical protein
MNFSFNNDVRIIDLSSIEVKRKEGILNKPAGNS